jgi:hypothetical protein
MIHFFSNHKIIFKLTNLVLLIVYLYPGSLAGFVVYNDFTKQPQLTPDFLNISSNHFYVFTIVSVLGVLTYFELKKFNYLFGFLILYSIILELLHIIIPKRTFQYEDLLGNLYGVLIVMIFWNIYKFYEKNK